MSNTSIPDPRDIRGQTPTLDSDQRLRQELADVLHRQDIDEVVIAGIWLIKESPHLKAGHEGRVQLRDAIGIERWDRLERVARQLHQKEDTLMSSGLARHDDEMPRLANVASMAEWIARHRPHGLQTLAETERYSAQHPSKFLLRGVLPLGARAILGADQGTGKGLATADLAVSATSGTPWLDQIPVDTVGSVIVYHAEDKNETFTRRAKAIAEARGLSWDDLAIKHVSKVPKLANDGDVEALEAALIWSPPPITVIIDPLYVAVEGASAAHLVEMGAMLTRAQEACERVGATLLITHHLNAAGCLVGAGPAEWARVIMILTGRAVAGDPATGRTEADLRLRISGNDIGRSEYTFRRSVWSDDPADLQSPMHYRITTPAHSNQSSASTTPSPSTRAEEIMQYLGTHDGATMTAIATYLKLSKTTVRTSVAPLLERKLVRTSVGPRNAVRHHLTDLGRTRMNLK